MEINFKDQTVEIKGDLTRTTVPQAYTALQQHKEKLKGADFSGLTDIDPAGAVFLEDMLSRMPDAQEAAEQTLPESLTEIFTTYKPSKLPEPPEQPASSYLLETGEKAAGALSELKQFFILAADTAVWTVTGLFNPRDRRKGSVIHHCYTMGVQALGIIGLLSFILGFILALQSAIQLRQFGAGLMTANLLTIALIYEMGPIMTSIILAGRTGSAIASEIATMKVTEELDALKMMSLHPVRFVLVPKVMAMTLVIPLLLTLSIFTGVIGGTIVAITYLEIPPINYLQQSWSVVDPIPLLRSYFKTALFSWVIVLIGAHYGFQVQGGAEEVGQATTKSVVAAIFAILVLDALFSFTLLL